MDTNRHLLGSNGPRGLREDVLEGDSGEDDNQAFMDWMDTISEGDILAEGAEKNDKFDGFELTENAEATGKRAMKDGKFKESEHRSFLDGVKYIPPADVSEFEGQ